VNQVPIRQLNQDTAGVLERVEAGESVEITRHGKVIGRIVPVVNDELAAWVATNRAVPATVTGPIPMPARTAPEGADSGALLSELRDSERW